MRSDDFTFISSAASSVVLLFLAIAVLHLFGGEPLWLAMAGGGQEFNPRYLIWLLALIPLGSLLGCLICVKQFERVRWLSCLIGWFVGCITGYVVFYPSVIFLGVMHPLLVSGVGLIFTLFVFWAAHKNAREKPSHIHLPM